MRRVSLRVVGATASKIAALPNGATKVELLTLATKKLGSAVDRLTHVDCQCADATDRST